MNDLLKKYWVKIANNGINFGYGIEVTAYSEDDILKIVENKIPNQVEIESIKEIFSLEELEQNHVLPNMEEFVSRGIWFP